MAVENNSLLAKLRASQKAQGIKTEAVEPPDVSLGSFEEFADLIPELDDAYERTQEDLDIDSVVDGIGIIRAYERWANKGTVPSARTDKVEGIKVRCPNPAHPDHNPSAWLNTEKDVWACGGCGMAGGDKFDIAAWNFGYDVPGYKGPDFPKLKRKMAEDLGYTVKRTPGGLTVVTGPPEEESEGESESDDDEGEAAPDNVIHITPRPADLDATPMTPTIDWRSILRGDTFMSRWMHATEIDDLPEEYYFWLGMTLVGLGVAGSATLSDNPKVKGNLFICLYGNTGIGKSRSINTALRLLREALPYEHSVVDTGVYLVPSPGSPEALIDSFSKPDEASLLDDTTDDKYLPVRGLVRFDELSTLVGRSDRAGSTMKPTLMEFFDSYNPVEHRTRGHGYVRAEGHFASCLTTTQPKAIRVLLTQTDADAGFVNRWIFASGVPKTPQAFGREEIDISRCVEPLNEMAAMYTDKFTAGSGEIGMDEDALVLWSNFFYGTLNPTKMGDDTNLLSRMDLTLKKIMLLFAIDRQLRSVGVQEVEDTIALWDYLRRSYLLLADEIGVGIFEDCRHAIAAIAISHHHRTKKHATAREITKNIGKAFSSALVLKVIETMCALGELSEYSDRGAAGKSIVRYAYVD